MTIKQKGIYLSQLSIRCLINSAPSAKLSDLHFVRANDNRLHLPNSLYRLGSHYRLYTEVSHYRLYRQVSHYRMYRQVSHYRLYRQVVTIDR